ncbi:MAG: hypothetical protein ACOYEP_06480 [Limnochordia bacterium]|jgi:hypothetical protein
MMSRSILATTLFVIALMTISGCHVLAQQPSSWKGYLRPTPATMSAQAEHALSMPFYQAVPVARGLLYPSHLLDSSQGLRHDSGAFIPASLTANALWPDGSVRWLGVDGVWPADLPLDVTNHQGIPVVLGDMSAAEAVRSESPPPVHGLVVRDGQVHLIDVDGRAVAVLEPLASYVDITEPKSVLPDSVPDDQRQYAWAELLEALNKEPRVHSLDLTVRECVVERENDLYTVYRLRGDGGETDPGKGLEWQLRVRIYRAVPVVRFQMTWALHWDPEKHALAQAAWTARFSTPFAAAGIPEVTPLVDLASGAFQLQSEVTAHSQALHGSTLTASGDWPDPRWNTVLVATEGNSPGYLAVGVPNFTRLGPNRIRVDEHSVLLASWSDHAGQALDLRVTTSLDEFEIAERDVNASAVGLMSTLESCFVWGPDAESTASLALAEARRDTLWLPSREDIITTGALGPISSDTFLSNREYFSSVNANLHFILASRDHWRWTGFANFGDIRTNFSRSSLIPERGLYPGRWALNGRYGWRKGSGEPFYGMWLMGLLLEERDVALAAFDYALHVANIDVSHGSFFRPNSRNAGGMHRRNKDHWSGSIEVQYTPSSGLYLAKWLTGHERLEDTLAEVRSYAANHEGNSSAYAAGAWILRYAETHSDHDLRKAQTLLNKAAQAWEGVDISRMEPHHLWGNLAPDAQLKGLAALYKSNFRLTLDGIPTLIAFYESTDDAIYLEAIRTSVQAHGVPTGTDTALGNYYGLAYLLARGYSEEDVGEEAVRTARLEVAKLLNPSSIPPREHWDYITLSSIGATESANIGWRSRYSPVVMGVFGHPPTRIDVGSPPPGAIVKGPLTIEVAWVNPAVTAEITDLKLVLDDDAVLHTGSELPSPGAIVVDTMELADGKHSLTLVGNHQRHGLFEHQWDFQVRNRWTLVQQMNPPHIAGGWWAEEIDYLQTAQRSAGWTYDTERGEEFFGDEERLVKATDDEEYLIWETPHLIEGRATLYCKPHVEIQKTLKLDVSSSGDDWQPMEYQVKEDEGEHGWRQVSVSFKIEDEWNRHWFRLTLTDAYTKEDVQIGDVVISGYLD